MAVFWVLAVTILVGFSSMMQVYPAISATGASLGFSPSQGEYYVEGTFEVSIVVNTGGNAINAVEAFVSFPADKLQVVNPTVSKSFIEIWVAGPSYSNTEGKISFQGGLPSPGITTSSGVVSTIQFRAKSSGKATLKFSDSSKILANDGQGTNILTSKSQATFNIQLPPPAGPLVVSSTHEDQNKWYNNRSATLLWETKTASSGFSYIFDSNPSTVPEEKVNTTDTKITENLKTDGIWYFHIRAQNQTGWGGTTHFSLKIDSTGPAAFTPQLDRTSLPTGSRSLAKFSTTDAVSGISHYEVRVINDQAEGETTGFFTEQQSPYQLPELPQGGYKLIVRAYDNAGNYSDGIAEFTIGSAGAALTTSTLFKHPLINNLIVILLILAVLVLLWLWAKRYRHERALFSLKRNLTDLRTTVAQKETELRSLLEIQQNSDTELQNLEVAATEMPSFPPSNPATTEPIITPVAQPLPDEPLPPQSPPNLS